MLNKGEIETCKEEARNYIEFMKTAGDNAGWTRGLLWYIEQLEKHNKELGKGQYNLIQSRRKWKRRYYNLKQKINKIDNIVNNLSIEEIESIANKELEKLCNECSTIAKEVGFTKEDLDKTVEETREIQRKAEKYDQLVEMLEEEIKYENVEINGSKKKKFLFELLCKNELKTGIRLVNAYRTELLAQVDEK